MDTSAVARWELGKSEPLPYKRPKLARLLKVSLEELEQLLQDEPTAVEPATTSGSLGLQIVADHEQSGSTEPIDDSYILRLRQQMQQLLAIDAQYGGNEASGQAVRLFRSVHRRVGTSPCPRNLRRDLYATAGELAEIAGWLLYDADQQDATRRINQEALYYLQWAGDRSLELLTLQNMAMQAEYVHRPSEALHIVESVTETDHLSPRLQSLFLARGSHALAQQKQCASAQRMFDQAHSLYLDGTRDSDPSWAYWVDDLQFGWFEAMLSAELGNLNKTVDIFADMLAKSPKHRVRGLYSRSVYLFDSLVRVGDWRQAEQFVPQLTPYIQEVGSGRTASILRGTIRHIHHVEAPSNLRDGAVHLRGLLEGSGLPL